MNQVTNKYLYVLHCHGSNCFTHITNHFLVMLVTVAVNRFNLLGAICEFELKKSVLKWISRDESHAENCVKLFEPSNSMPVSRDKKKEARKVRLQHGSL